MPSFMFLTKSRDRSASVEYRHLGKDIYQIEVPKKLSVPSEWIQISTTSVSIAASHIFTHCFSNIIYFFSRKLRVIGTIKSSRWLLNIKNCWKPKMHL